MFKCAANILEIASVQVCRLCLVEEEDLVYLFNPKGYQGFQLWKLIEELLQTELSKEDGMPWTVCKGCVSKLKEFKHFKSTCIQSKISFLSMMVNRGSEFIIKDEDNADESLSEAETHDQDILPKDDSSCMGVSNDYSLANPLNLIYIKEDADAVESCSEAGTCNQKNHQEYAQLSTVVCFPLVKEELFWDKEEVDPRELLAREETHGGENLAEDQTQVTSISHRISEPQLMENMLHNTMIETILREDPINDENMPMEEAVPDYRTLYEEEKEHTKILEAKIASLCLKIEELERDIKALDDKKAQSVQTEVENTLTKVFSKNQVALLLNKRKWVHWTSDEISKAFTLRYLGKRAYIYLKSELKFPLPGMSSLQRWASKIEMRHGILTDVMRVLRMTADGMDDLQRLTVLLFDEMKVASTLEYDSKHDEIVGPNSSMMVVMARGLCGKWKQPVYVDFDQKMTKAIFHRIITELHQAGYKVVSCVSDMGGGNIGLWKELGISHLAPHFAHPVTQEPIFYFPDVPHLFKLLRNWLLDTGFVLEDGRSITRQPLDSLLQLTSTEMSVCHKLHEGHLTCEGSQRQNVRLATQLVSHTTATALLHYLPGPSSDLARDTGRFIDLMNDWFDLMNVYNPSNSLRPSLCAYGKRVEHQIALLDEVYQTVNGMRCCGKQSLQLFQRGILMSITSLKQLWEYGRSCGVAYILTTKLNQDALENLFSQLRTRGGLHDHPAPLNALNRLRMIILGKNPGAVQTRVNVNVAADEEFVFAAAVRAADLDSADLNVTISHVTSSETDTDKEVVSWSQNPRKNVPNQSTKPTQAVGELATESTEDAMEYFAGWLAKKYKGSHPHLGTNGENLKCHDYALPSWVSHLSYGGLISPSATFKVQVLKMEKFFQEFVGPFLPKRRKTVKSLTSKIMQKMDNGEIDEKIVKTFVKHRVGIRLKYLKNKGLLGQVKAKAKFQKLCKMKKTVT